MVVSTRIIDGKESRDARYYISSLDTNAERLLHIVRKHWAIENELWYIALNLLKQEKTARGGIHAKQLQAACNDEYLLKILAAAN